MADREPDEEDRHEEHVRAVMDWTADVGEPGDIPGIEEALYAHDEMHLWPDDVTVGLEQALKCWQVVEACRRKGFPRRLAM